MKRKKHSNAYERFHLVINRSEEIVKAGNFGIGKQIDEKERLYEKFSDIKGIPGKMPKGFIKHVNVTREEKEGELKLTLDQRSAFLIKKVLSFNKTQTEELNNHLYSIMLVYIWGSFETYIIMMFEELFVRKNQLLKTSESITFREIIENEKNILRYLLDKELENIGHFSLENIFDYLQKKINLVFPKTIQDRLRSIYLLRNIIAHNTGITNNRNKNRIPKRIKIKENEIYISKSYLNSEIKFIKTVVNRIESHVELKFKNET